MTVEVHASDAFGDRLAAWFRDLDGSGLLPAAPLSVLASAALAWRALEPVGSRWTAERRTWLPALAERGHIVVGPLLSPRHQVGCLRCLRARYEAAFADGPHRRALGMIEASPEARSTVVSAFSPWSVAFAGATALDLARGNDEAGTCVVADLGEVSVRRLLLLPSHGCACRTSTPRLTASLEEAFQDGVGR